MPDKTITALFIGSLIIAVQVYPSTGIIGGKEVVPHSLPYQVGLWIPTSSGSSVLCGGSLISAQTVLTTSSCLNNAIGPVEVVLGAHNILITESSQVRINASYLIRRSDWYPKSPLNDIALVRLPEPVTFNTYIQPIDIPLDNNEEYENKTATMSGWGYVTDYFREYSPKLMKVELPILNNFSCELAYLGDIDENNLCVSGKNGKATCTGDTGGALVLDNVQIGIMSPRNTIFACDEGLPTGYVRVGGFLNWIKTHIV